MSYRTFGTSAGSTVNEARRAVQRFLPKPDGATFWAVGGSIRDSVWGMAPQHDVDLFFQSRADLEATERWLLDAGAELLFLSPKKTSYAWRGIKYDLIGSWFEALEDVLAEVDFTVACAGVDPGQKLLMCHEDYFEDLAAKQLRIQSLPNPASTLMRVARYSRMGFTLSYGDAMRLAKRIREHGEEGSKAFALDEDEDGLTE